MPVIIVTTAIRIADEHGIDLGGQSVASAAEEIVGILEDGTVPSPNSDTPPRRLSSAEVRDLCELYAWLQVNT